MGKGDRKTRRGKLARGSYGKSRPKHQKKKIGKSKKKKKTRTRMRK